MSGGREVIFEFIEIGASVRVAAVDVASGIEVVIVGPKGAARGDLETLALKKLERTLAGQAPAPPARPGKIV